jgi:hypothetical protein
MEVERVLSYILSPTKEGYRSCPSHDVKHPTSVPTPHEFSLRSTLHSYYKLTKEDLEEIIKDLSAELLIPTDPS